MVLQAWRRWRRERQSREIANQLYLEAVAQARKPVFYTIFEVPDTLDGRFEMIALIGHMMLRRLRREGDAGAALSQAYFDAMFMDMDRNLRELGVSDTAIGKRMKKMMQGFYGRIAAYDEGLSETGDQSVLSQALARNLYGTVTVEAALPEAIAGYVRELDRALAAQPFDALAGGKVVFPEPE